MPSSLASTLGRKARCPPTLIPRKKTIKAMLPIVAALKYRGEAEAVGQVQDRPFSALGRSFSPVYRRRRSGSRVIRQQSGRNGDSLVQLTKNVVRRGQD